MARDKVTYDSYQQDVFDNPPKGPVGVHRGSRSLWAKIAPFIIVLVVAALCGFGAWAGITGEYKNLLGLTSSQSTTADTSATKADTAAKSDTKSDSSDSASTDSSSSDSSSTDNANNDSANTSTQDEQQQPDPASTVNKDTQVRVVNATGIGGYAGQKADNLKTAGYTSVEATNPTGSVPPYTVVWYSNETDKATAEDVASTLGITAVEQVQGLSAPITVVLLN